MNGYSQKDLRRLRRRLDALERDIYETDVLIRLLRNGNQPDREEAIQNYHLENAERQEEVDEIRYVLDYMPRRRSAGWPNELKFALIVLSTVVLLLAAFAVVRTF
jgi:hypothetical protein